ncbi:MAG: hypothetical protein AAB890_02920 [Patescibacteria group bacterium]
MKRCYVLETNEWGESVKRYVDNPPGGGAPDPDALDPWRAERDWQKRNRVFIKDVKSEDDDRRDPYDDVKM